MLPQDVFNLVAVDLDVSDLRNLALSSLSLTAQVRDENVWKALIGRDYPALTGYSLSHWFSYVREYTRRHQKTYVYVSHYYVKSKGWQKSNYGESQRFLTIADLIEEIWTRYFDDRPIDGHIHKLNGNFKRLLEHIDHWTILEIHRSENPMSWCLQMDSIRYELDMTYEECVDLINDYVDELKSYRQTVQRVLTEKRAIIDYTNWRKAYPQGTMLTIEERRGVSDLS